MNLPEKIFQTIRSPLPLLALIVVLECSCRKQQDSVENEPKVQGVRDRGATQPGSRVEQLGMTDLSDPKNWLSDGVPVKLDSTSIIQLLHELGPDKWDLQGENGGYLRSLFYWCKPEDFDEALAIFSRTRGENGKAIYLQSMLERYAREKGPGALSAMLASIKKHFGSGQQSQDARFKAFQAAGISKDTFAELREIQDLDERNFFLRGLSWSLEYKDSLSSIKDINISSLSDSEKSLFFSALALRVKNYRGIGKELSEVINETFEIVTDPKEASLLIVKCSESAPFEMWDAIADQARKIGVDGVNAARRASVAAMAKQNGESAMKRIVQLESGKERAELLQTGMTAFLAANPVRAEAWLKENNAKLSANENDSISVALAQSTAGNNDFTAAREISNKIKNPELRASADGKIWEAERTGIRKEVASNPVTTIQAIVSGESGYTAYWLEEAMSTWMEKDLDQAREWQEKNWNSIPANKSQYLAAAFAKQAAHEGDMATAREWATHIQDAKTRQRIEAAILAEEGGKGIQTR